MSAPFPPPAPGQRAYYFGDYRAWSRIARGLRHDYGWIPRRAFRETAASGHAWRWKLSREFIYYFLCVVISHGRGYTPAARRRARVELNRISRRWALERGDEPPPPMSLEG